MVRLEYRVNTLGTDGNVIGWTVYETPQEAYQAMSATAKEYETKGYQVRIDNKTVRVWNNIDTWPIVYKMAETHIEIGG